MWESPIKIISKQLNTQLDGDILKAVQEVGITVDKEELIKCIQYDRNQYDKGYKQGWTNAIDECIKALKSYGPCDLADKITLLEQLKEQKR